MNQVDLRSAYDQVYNQGSNPSCGPHAVTAALDCMYERVLNKQVRFSKDYIWEWSRFHLGLAGQSVGSTFESLEKTLRVNGARLGDDVIRGFRLERTFVSDPTYTEMRNLLCAGFPVIWLMKATPDLIALDGKRNWRQHHLSTDTSETWGMHFVAIVGYDDDAQMWLAENSWGPDWGDGGFFGIPYKSFSALTEGIMHINVAPINPKPVEGYKMPMAYMLTNDRAAFAERVTPALIEVLTKAMTDGDVPGLIAACKKWGVGDKHLETMLGWERGSVRSFKTEHPSLEWDDFVWEQ